jgi:hypothetical protein
VFHQTLKTPESEAVESSLTSILKRGEKHWSINIKLIWASEVCAKEASQLNHFNVSETRGKLDGRVVGSREPNSLRIATRR